VVDASWRHSTASYPASVPVVSRQCGGELAYGGNRNPALGPEAQYRPHHAEVNDTAFVNGHGAFAVGHVFQNREVRLLPGARGLLGIDLPVWLVGHRVLRNLPRIKAVWTFLEEVTAALE
jgi:hypothetical protein